ncbi:MAG: IPT/TIG domain-containing protein [Candidatus Binatia bacterium]
MRTAAFLILIGTLWQVRLASALAEPVRSGFDVVTLSIGVRGASAPVEPVYAPATSPSGDTALLVQDGAGTRLDVREVSGITRTIVAVGDVLAGSAVMEIATAANALDNYQQVVFWAALADGRAGLFRASPPPAPFAISPKSGYRDQPITIHLMGRGFAPGVRVRVGTIDAGLVTIVSPTELTGMLPAGAPLGVADVAVSRLNGGSQTLRGAFEFQDRPPSGCRGFWPDHRPPATTASSVASSWLVPIGIAALPRGWRRLTRRKRTRSVGRAR